MPDYRIYNLSKTGAIFGRREIVCDTDADAVAYARKLVAGFGDVEVWCGARMVLGRSHTGDLGPATPSPPDVGHGLLQH